MIRSWIGAVLRWPWVDFLATDSVKSGSPGQHSPTCVQLIQLTLFNVIFYESSHNYLSSSPAVLFLEPKVFSGLPNILPLQ